MNVTPDQRERLHRFGIRPEDYPGLAPCGACGSTDLIDIELSLLSGAYCIWCACRFGSDYEQNNSLQAAVDDWNRNNT